MSLSPGRKIWNVIYPFLLIIGIYLLVYLIAILTYFGFLSSSFGSLTDFMAAGGDIVSIAALTLSAVVLFVFYKRDYVPKSGDFLKKPLCIILIIIVGALLSHGLSIFIALINLDGIIGNYSEAETSIYSSSVIVTVIKTVILAPLAEELAFRGLIYNRMKFFTNFWLGAIVSSVLFGIYHMNLAQGVYAFLYGICLCLVYDCCKNLISTMIMHAAANAFGIAMTYSGFAYPSIWWTYTGAMVICIALSVCIYLFYFRKQKKLIG